ncbi:MAG: ABC transporter permease, partial [Thermoleophilaceae bacterium]
SLLHAIHPFVLTHNWLAFADLFRSPLLWTGILHGLWVSAAYAAIFLIAAVARFERRDVTS